MTYRIGQPRERQLPWACVPDLNVVKARRCRCWRYPGRGARHHIRRSKGAEVNRRGRYRDTALHIAARSGEEGLLRLLLDYGARLDLLNKKRKTPFDVASIHGQRECATLLKEGQAAREGQP
jgi:ankyrin repeat protein